MTLSASTPTANARFGHAAKALWPLADDLLYFNHGTVGVTPKQVLAEQQRIQAEIEREPSRFLLLELSTHQTGSRLAAPRLRTAAAEVAAFVRARPEDIVFVDNITTGANAVLRSFPFAAGDEVLVNDLGYGAVTFSAQYAAGLRGATARAFEMPFPIRDPQQVVDAYVAAVGPKTRLAIVDHITSSSALVMPVKEIVAALHARGVQVLVDAAHAPAQLDLDVPSFGADWYVANLHKWACAPRSCAFLWAPPERQAMLHPPVISWGFGHGYVAEFEHWGTRDPSTFLAAPAGLAFLRELGVDAMRRYQHELAWETGRILTSRWGTTVDAPRAMTASMITVPLPARAGSTDAEAQALRDALLDEERMEVQMHAWRGRVWARVCAQVYVEAGDVEKLADAVIKRIGS